MIYYFDMDGTICDLERSFVDRTGIPISTFSAMSKEEKDVIKKDLFTREFFASLHPLDAMLGALKALHHSGRLVKILTATGHNNVNSVKAGKRDWVNEHIGDRVQIIFVDKVQHKGEILKSAVSGHHHLFDDRPAAIESWLEAQKHNKSIKVTATLVSH